VPEGDKKGVIIVTKRRGDHGAAHGGAWKVAYADFVTALMALFIVLWIMGQSPETRKAIEAYFQQPWILAPSEGFEAKVLKISTESAIPTAPDGKLSLILTQIEEAMKAPEFGKIQKYLQMTVTKDGLRIELIEGEDAIFFDPGSSRLTPAATRLLKMLGELLAQFPKNPLAIEGHTDATPYPSTADRPYSNWELSCDRANAARRVLDPVLNAGQVSEVRGFGPTQLKNPSNPRDPSNRRVTILVRPEGATVSTEPIVETGAGDIESAARAIKGGSESQPVGEVIQTLPEPPPADTGTGAGTDAGGPGGSGGSLLE
jgi:chemotaxis protein MotB